MIFGGVIIIRCLTLYVNQLMSIYRRCEFLTIRYQNIMKPIRIISMLFVSVILLGALQADAQTKKRAKTTSTAKTTSAAPAKVATELPADFTAMSFLKYRKDWEAYQFRDDNASRLGKMGFKLVGRGTSRVLTSSEYDTYKKVKNGTFDYDGIKVTIKADGEVDKIVFPNKATLNQFIATALQNGMYENNGGEYYSFQAGGLCSFYIKGLTVVYDTNP